MKARNLGSVCVHWFHGMFLFEKLVVAQFLEYSPYFYCIKMLIILKMIICNVTPYKYTQKKLSASIFSKFILNQTKPR
jgi:hypothetical protein